MNAPLPGNGHGDDPCRKFIADFPRQQKNPVDYVGGFCNTNRLATEFSDAF